MQANTPISTKRIFKDTLISAIPKIVSICAGILTSILLARGLGAKGLGEYTLIISIATLVAELSDLGINQSAIRFASQASSDNDTEAQNSVLRWAFRIRLLLLLIITGILFLCVPYITNKLWQIPYLTNILRLSLLIGIFTTLAAIPTIYFQSLKRFKTNALVQTLQTIISTSGIILIAIINKWSVGAVILASIIATAFSALFFFQIVPKAIFFEKSELKNFFKSFFKISQNKNISDKFQKEIKSFTYYMVIASIIGIISTKIDLWIIGTYLDKIQTGLYSLALRMVLPVTAIYGALQTVVLPRISPCRGYDENLYAIKKFLKPALIISGIFILYSLLVPLFIPFIFGQEYQQSIILAQLLCFRASIYFITYPINVIGYNFGLVKTYTKIMFIENAILTILYLCFVPKFGAIAVAISMVIITIIFQAIKCFYACYALIKSKN